MTAAMKHEDTWAGTRDHLAAEYRRVAEPLLLSPWPWCWWLARRLIRQARAVERVGIDVDIDDDGRLRSRTVMRERSG